MKIRATPIAFAAFCLGMTIVTAAAAERDTHPESAPQVALQPVAASADVAEGSSANCLVPGDIRSFGGLTILTPRRAVTLPAAECISRGGEPIAGTATTE
jgi:hypothetical protein